jgi:hypothetical protein
MNQYGPFNPYPKTGLSNDPVEYASCYRWVASRLSGISETQLHQIAQTLMRDWNNANREGAFLAICKNKDINASQPKTVESKPSAVHTLRYVALVIASLLLLLLVLRSGLLQK